MKEASDNDAWTVTQWVAIVTLDLAAPARERIKVEIEAHYADAVNSRVADGLAREDAEAAALLALGDPFAARKSFRERHLTFDEEKWMCKWLAKLRIYGTSWWYWVELGNNLMIGWVWWSLSCRIQKVTVSLDLAAVLVFGIYCAYVIARLRFRFLIRHSSAESGFVSELLLIEPLSIAILGVFFGMATRLMVLCLLVLSINFVTIGIWARKRLSLWRKLRYAQSSDDQGLAA